jgi:hypothetical protein
MMFSAEEFAMAIIALLKKLLQAGILINGSVAERAV